MSKKFEDIAGWWLSDTDKLSQKQLEAMADRQNQLF